MFLFPVLALLSMTRSLAHGLQGVYAIYVWLPLFIHVMFILLHVTNLLGFVSLLNIYSCLLSTYWVVLNFTLFTASSNLRITKMSNICFNTKIISICITRYNVNFDFLSFGNFDWSFEKAEEFTAFNHHWYLGTIDNLPSVHLLI